MEITNELSFKAFYDILDRIDRYYHIPKERMYPMIVKLDW